ncbi:hypothetical protein BJ166DRAFT_205090 [Pestalotiopsis sp. NC0098]|nr:hypothetical protein BJ166DRAFT_205090 [Pestalotiopsis sp. NC0098]
MLTLLSGRSMDVRTTLLHSFLSLLPLSDSRLPGTNNSGVHWKDARSHIQQVQVLTWAKLALEWTTERALEGSSGTSPPAPCRSPGTGALSLARGSVDAGGALQARMQGSLQRPILGSRN